jgi:hypothetical protein
MPEPLGALRRAMRHGAEAMIEARHLRIFVYGSSMNSSPTRKSCLRAEFRATTYLLDNDRGGVTRPLCRRDWSSCTRARLADGTGLPRGRQARAEDHSGLAETKIGASALPQLAA